jgi:ArsR family transcriptional regulator
MTNAAELFRALGDPTRLRIVKLLLHRELAVGELAQALGVPQYNVSRHLAVLKRVGLLSGRRVGACVYYQPNPDLGDLGRYLFMAVDATAEAGQQGR